MTLMSAHFTLAELTTTSHGSNPVSGPEILTNLKALCVNVLEPTREHFKLPVTINSGYRSPQINARIKGSSKTSQHMLGEAADFCIRGVDNLEVARWISQNLNFDQLILEFYVPGQSRSGWVHCSYVANRVNRKEMKRTNTVMSNDGSGKANFSIVGSF